MSSPQGGKKKRKRALEGGSESPDDTSLNAVFCPEFNLAAIRKQMCGDNVRLNSHTLVLIGKLLKQFLQRLADRLYTVKVGDAEEGEHLNPRNSVSVEVKDVVAAVKAVLTPVLTRQALVDGAKACRNLRKNSGAKLINSGDIDRCDTDRFSQAELIFRAPSVHVIDAGTLPFKMSGNADIYASAVVVRHPPPFQPLIPFIICAPIH
jgi:hypothetical protein